MKIAPAVERAALMGLAVAATVPAMLWLTVSSLPLFKPAFLARAEMCARGGKGPYVTGLCESGAEVQLALFALSIVLAALIAIAAMRRESQSPQVRYLARFLSLGAASMSCALFVAPLVRAVGAGLLVQWLVHLGVLLAAARCFADAYRFLRHFPSRVALEPERGADAVRPMKWAKLKRVNESLLRTFDEPDALFHILLFGAALDLAVFAISQGKLAGGTFLLIAAVVATLEAISAMTYNARHLGEVESGQEWLFIGIWVVVLAYLLIPFLAILFALGAAVASPEEFFSTDPTRMPTDASELFTYWAASTLLMGIEPLSLVAVLVLLAISFFYHGSLDPRLTIRRATIVSILLALGGLAFVFAERYVVAAIVQALGLSHDITWAVAGLVAGGVVVPARRIVDSGVRTLIDRITPATDLADGEPMDAAVVFSDLSGFTALSARDERAGIVAASLLHKMAREVARERRGRLVKTVGDATVMEFESADDAVAATHALHERYAKGSEVLGLPALAVHSGINAGKYVKAHDGDIYGSTVNLAARLQDAAGAGEVVVSQEVHKRVTSSAFRWVDLGARDFKNLPVPVPVLRLVAG